MAPAVPVVAGVLAAAPPVPAVPVVSAVDPAVPEVPDAPPVGSVVAVFRPVMPDALVAVEVPPVSGETWPPDKLTDVADVLLVIPDGAGVLVTPGVDVLI
jgi:hypothetical protein